MSTITLFESFRRPGAYILSTVKEIQQKLVNIRLYVCMYESIIKNCSEIEKNVFTEFYKKQVFEFCGFCGLKFTTLKIY